MKKTIIWSGVALCLLVVACGKGNQEQQQAEELQQQAQTAYEKGNYKEALLLIDSVKHAYPKAFDVRQKGVDLKNQVVIAQAQKVVAEADSMRIVLQQEIQTLCSKLVLVKNKTYEERGNYFFPSQQEASNLSRSYLRAQVSEDGMLVLTSVYRGGVLSHTRIRITAPGGPSIETTVGSPFKEGGRGNATEKVDYLEEHNAVAVARFISEHVNSALRLEFLGSRPHAVSFPLSDRKGIAAVYQLYEKMAALSKLTKEKEDALLKIRFYNEKVEQKKKTSSLAH